VHYSRRAFCRATASVAATHLRGGPAAAADAPPPAGEAREPSPSDGFISVKTFGATGDGTSDDTAAIQTAIDVAVGNVVVFPPGTYLVGGLKLPSDVRLVGSSVAYTYLKVKPGFTGPAITDTGNATRIQIEQLVLDCADQAAGNGIELGLSQSGPNTQHNFLAWLRGVRVRECPGIAFRIHSNVSELVDVWASYGNGTGMELSGTVVRAHRVACEGSVERELLLRCTDAHISGLHVETGVRDTPLLIDGYGAVLDGVTLSVDRATAIEDVIRMTARSAGCELRGVRINLNQPGSDYVTLLRDEASGVTITKQQLPHPLHLGLYLQRGLPNYLGELRGMTRFTGGVAFTPITMADGEGAPSVRESAVLKAANSRATTITDFSGAVEGQEITIVLDGRTTIESNARIRLRGQRGFRGRRGDTMTLIRVDGVWYEKSRSAG